MKEDTDLILAEAEDGMKSTISHLEDELSKIRAGKASPSMLDAVQVEYYGTMTPLNQVSNVNTPDAKTIRIQPWEKGMLDVIEKGITNSNTGLNPQNNGDVIMINVPPLTEERRKELVKRARSEAETAKVSIRTARKEANDEIKKLQKDGLSEDLANDAEESIQQLTDKYNSQADKEVDRKEEAIMTI
jgi:ribosome recycling factor